MQKVVSLSTTEAEFIVATEAVKEALWLQGFVSELGYKQKTVTVYCDNQSVIYLVRNPMFHERSKHVDIKLHFIREVVSSGAVKVDKIATKENPVDALTKSLPIAKFELCLNLVNIFRN